MSYLVLARKWRPGSFDDIIGQDFIRDTLKNAVETKKIAHALIFSGPRGVGKTSTARIVAKALNCQSGPTPEPCSECVHCKEITDGKSLDVLEIDAASHTGVNDVREIIDNVKYLPSSARYKIYIIDEAHMLSQSAFNALLKTLEEPPPHVVFILATTEIHKVPVTILSRCQRYDFKKVRLGVMERSLTHIAGSEGIKIDPETVSLIAHEADGSVRDALSLFDQLIATFGDVIKHDEATDTLGILDRSILRSLLSAIVAKDPKSSLGLIQQAADRGVSAKRMAQDLLRAIRAAAIIKTCGDQDIDLLSKDDTEDIKRLTQGTTEQTLEMLFGLMLEGAEELERSYYPELVLERTVLRLCMVEPTLPIDDILERLDKLSKQIGGGTKEDRSPTPSQDRDEPTKEKPAKNEAAEPTTEARENTLQTGAENSEEFMDFMKHKYRSLATRLDQAESLLLEGDTLKIVMPKDSLSSAHLRKKDNNTALKRALKEYHKRDIGVDLSESAQTEAAKREAREKKLLETKKKLEDDPIVREALEMFGGRVLKIKPKHKE